MSNVIDIYGLRGVKVFDPSKYYAKDPQHPVVITSERVVGVEVEVENHGLKKDLRTPVWVQTQDGSLRNNGREWITSPIKGIWAPHALRELLGDSLSDDCCFSPRTSTHVHVNCLDLDARQVVDVLLLYCCLEPFFYQFAGRGRSKNIYCVPLYDAAFVAFTANMKLESIVPNWTKYTGFNLLPLADKGTIEFRHMHGTFDHVKLANWIKLILKLFDYVLAKGTATIRKLVSGFSSKTDVMGLMIDVFGDDVNQFCNISYDTIRDAVLVTKTAFMKTETNLHLLKQRVSGSRYIRGVN
jgi:hypothetical protein